MKSGRGLRTLPPTHKTLIRMHKVLYLGLDAHARLWLLALMDASGRVIGTEAFSTSEAALIQAVSNAPARIKYLAVEESALAGWIANALRPHVDELIVCDRRHNALISRSGHKDDYADAIKLCRLHRMGKLKSVYPTDDSDRVDFKIAVQQYLALRRDHARLKTQIKAKYPQAGVVNVAGTQVFAKTERERYLEQVPSKARRQSIGRLYAMLDATGRVRKEARAAMVELGRHYPEIKQFRRVPGIGVVGAHVFSAFIQTPHRFATRQKLWRYCRLGIYPRRQAGESHLSGPLGIGRAESRQLPVLAVGHAHRGAQRGVAVLRSFAAPHGQQYPRPPQHAAQGADRTVDHLRCRLRSESVPFPCSRGHRACRSYAIVPCDGGRRIRVAGIGSNGCLLLHLVEARSIG